MNPVTKLARNVLNVNNLVEQAGICERRSNRGDPMLHAVSIEAQVSGLVKPDAECGQLIDELVGEWQTIEGRLCKRCLSVLASLDDLDLSA